MKVIFCETTYFSLPGWTVSYIFEYLNAKFQPVGSYMWDFTVPRTGIWRCLLLPDQHLRSNFSNSPFTLSVFTVSNLNFGREILQGLVRGGIFKQCLTMPSILFLVTPTDLWPLGPEKWKTQAWTSDSGLDLVAPRFQSFTFNNYTNHRSRKRTSLSPLLPLKQKNPTHTTYALFERERSARMNKATVKRARNISRQNVSAGTIMQTQGFPSLRSFRFSSHKRNV